MNENWGTLETRLMRDGRLGARRVFREASAAIPVLRRLGVHYRALRGEQDAIYILSGPEDLTWEQLEAELEHVSP